jgi:PIN domain nuclease of toxin-antitoxin system
LINLDTHLLVHAFAGQVTERERRILAANPWSISAIVQWELAKLTQLGRIELDIERAEFLRLLSSVHVWPLDLAVSIQSTRLDFRGDPADEIIVATSIVHKVPLLTRDRQVRRSRLVPFA